MKTKHLVATLGSIAILLAHAMGADEASVSVTSCKQLPTANFMGVSSPNGEIVSPLGERPAKEGHIFLKIVWERKKPGASTAPAPTLVADDNLDEKLKPISTILDSRMSMFLPGTKAQWIPEIKEIQPSDLSGHCLFEIPLPKEHVAILFAGEKIYESSLTALNQAAEKEAADQENAAARNYLLELKADLEKNKGDIEKRNGSGLTRLHIASREGYLDSVRYLVSRGADVDATFKEDKGTPVYLAVRNGHLDILKELVAAGADVSIPGHDNRTPLEVAESEGNAEAIRILKNAAEQGGAGQPATRPESKSEGSNKPQPESDGRSR